VNGKGKEEDRLEVLTEKGGKTTDRERRVPSWVKDTGRRRRTKEKMGKTDAGRKAVGGKVSCVWKKKTRQ